MENKTFTFTAEEIKKAFHFNAFEYKPGTTVLYRTDLIDQGGFNMPELNINIVVINSDGIHTIFVSRGDEDEVPSYYNNATDESCKNYISQFVKKYEDEGWYDFLDLNTPFKKENE